MPDELRIPDGWEYLWQDNAVYVRRPGGEWKLLMYFPPVEKTT